MMMKWKKKKKKKKKEKEGEAKKGAHRFYFRLFLRFFWGGNSNNGMFYVVNVWGRFDNDGDSPQSRTAINSTEGTDPVLPPPRISLFLAFFFKKNKKNKKK